MEATEIAGLVTAVLGLTGGGFALLKRIAKKTVDQSDAFVTELEASRDSWKEAAERLRDERDAERVENTKLRAQLHESALELVRTINQLESAHDGRTRPDPPPDAANQ